MSFTDGQRIAHEFLDDILRVYNGQEPQLAFDYHDQRYNQALQSPPDQLGMLLTVFTRFDVNKEKCEYASFRQTGLPELPYVYA